MATQYELDPIKTVSKPRKPTSRIAGEFEDAYFPALRLTRTSRIVRRLAIILMCLLALWLMGMLFLPWQQSISGSGTVTAYSPTERRQVIRAPVKGRIIAWGEGIRENSAVSKGQMILEIQDLDPLLMDRLQAQQDALERQLQAAIDHRNAKLKELEATQTIIAAYEANLEAFTSVKEQTVAAANEYIAMAKSKLDAEKQNLEAAKFGRIQSEADFERQRQLFLEQIKSQLDMQVAERKFLESKAKEEQCSSYVEAAESELRAKESERNSKEREAQSKIESANATLRKARADVAKAQGEAAKAESDIQKAEKDLLDMRVKLSRQESQVVVAPRDGFIMQLLAIENGEFIKEGDLLFEIVPKTDQQAVQVWVNGNDAPLIASGRHARLQFEGWPALQFSGWPSVAVGTFGGKVALVDATDDGTGKFRVVIVPDPDEPAWPGQQYLRQGTRVNGWVLLERVSFGFEVWRRMNGFPPVLQSKEGKVDGKKSLPKLKK
jgi:multidrug efflux pump subunit AcrA (membrane-fusion protein)